MPDGTRPTLAPGAPRPATQQPQLVRTQSTYSGTPRVCQGSTTDSDTGTHYGVHWCIRATATPVSDGVRLSVQVCRDCTGGSGTLTFGGTREVDLSVVQDGRTV